MNRMTNLVIARLERGLTQPQLAKLSGYSTQSILRWENGTRSPKVEVLEKIALILGKSVSELIGYSNPIHPPVPLRGRARKKYMLKAQ